MGTEISNTQLKMKPTTKPIDDVKKTIKKTIKTKPEESIPEKSKLDVEQFESPEPEQVLLPDRSTLIQKSEPQLVKQPTDNKPEKSTPEEIAEPTTALLPDEDKSPLHSTANLVKKPTDKKPKKLIKKSSVETNKLKDDTITIETTIKSVDTVKKSPEKSELNVKQEKTEVTLKTEDSKTLVETPDTPKPTKSLLPDGEEPSTEKTETSLVMKPIHKKPKKLSHREKVEIEPTKADTITMETEITSIEVVKRIPEKSEVDLKPETKEITSKVIGRRPDTTPEKTEMKFEKDESPKPSVAELPEQNVPSTEKTEAKLVRKSEDKKTKKLQRKESTESNLTNKETTQLETSIKEDDLPAKIEITSNKTTKKVPLKSEVDLSLVPKEKTIRKSSLQVARDDLQIETLSIVKNELSVDSTKQPEEVVDKTLILESKKTTPEKTEIVAETTETPEPSVVQLPQKEEKEPLTKKTDILLVKKPTDKKPKKSLKEIDVESDSVKRDSITAETELTPLEVAKIVPEPCKAVLPDQEESFPERSDALLVKKSAPNKTKKVTHKVKAEVESTKETDTNTETVTSIIEVEKRIPEKTEVSLKPETKGIINKFIDTSTEKTEITIKQEESIEPSMTEIPDQKEPSTEISNTQLKMKPTTKPIYDVKKTIKKTIKTKPEESIPEKSKLDVEQFESPEPEQVLLPDRSTLIQKSEPQLVKQPTDNKPEKSTPEEIAEPTTALLPDEDESPLHSTANLVKKPTDKKPKKLIKKSSVETNKLKDDTITIETTAKSVDT